MQPFYVKPSQPDGRIEDPETGDLLPADGDWKPRDPHWLREIMRGDVVEAEPPEEAGAGEDQPMLTAVHRGNGSYSVMRGDAELIEHLSSDEADAFNALDAAGRAAYLADHRPT